MPLECVEIETAPQPRSTVLWLHGLGADGHDFEPIVSELDLPDIAIRFIFPHAPLRPVTINGGMVMRAWYDISDAAIRQEDEQGIRSSQHQVEALIEREIVRGTNPARLVLAGFSQGGAIALQTGLRHRERIAGIMALSCYLPIADTLDAEASAAARGLPIFQAHGSFDPVVVFSRAAASRDRLLERGYEVEWHEYPMPHAVCAEEIGDIGAWLRRVLVQSD